MTTFEFTSMTASPTLARVSLQMNLGLVPILKPIVQSNLSRLSLAEDMLRTKSETAELGRSWCGHGRPRDPQSFVSNAEVRTKDTYQTFLYLHSLYYRHSLNRYIVACTYESFVSNAETFP